MTTFDQRPAGPAHDRLGAGQRLRRLVRTFWAADAHRMQRRLRDRTPVAMCHPQPLVRWVLAAAEMAGLVDDSRSD